MMSNTEIAGIRRDLWLSQVEIGRIIGVAGSTVSRWERGVSRPTEYHEELLKRFKRANFLNPSAGAIAKDLIVTRGSVEALWFLLNESYR